MSGDYITLQRGSRKLRAKSVGEGPPVVLDIGGGGGGVDNWGSLEGELAQFARVISYDRSGVGESDPIVSGPTLESWMDDLHAVVTEVAKGPATIMGWSLSGVIAVAAAFKYPQSVAGLVLVDPLTDEFFDKRSSRILFRIAPITMAWRRLKARTGIYQTQWGQRRVAKMIDKHIRDLAPELRAKVIEGMSAPGGGKAMALETKPVLGAVRDAKALRLASPSVDIPVIVLSATRRPAQTAQFRSHHERLVGLFPRGRLIVAEGSGHHIPYERPDYVVSVVRDLISEISVHEGDS
jgi:pimeloyl-ACP methyl ester carboxylesterase